MKNFIADFRKARGLTQQALTEALNVSYTQIQGWEHGRRTPSLETAIRLSRALNVSVEELFVLDNTV